MPRGGRKKGAISHKTDAGVVAFLCLLCPITKLHYGWSYFRTIRSVVEHRQATFLLKGKSTNAIVHRLYQKMMSGKYGSPVTDPRVINNLKYDPEQLQFYSAKTRRSKSK
jgi:hypothetical protein